MKDQDRTKGQLISELAEMRQRIVDLEAVEAERKWTEEALRREHDLVQALDKATASLTATLDPDQVLDRILEQVVRVVPNDTANIMLVEEARRVRIVRWRGYERFGAEAFVSTVAFDLDQLHSLQQMAETGEPIIISDTKSYPGWVSVPEQAWLRSYAGAPIRVRGEVIGFLNVDSATPGFFTQADAEALRTFTNQAAAALENARLFEETQAHSRYLETLQRINATLRSTLPLQEVLETICRGTGETLGYVGCLIVIPDAASERLTLAAVWGSRFLDAAVRFTGLEVASFSLPLTAEKNPMARAYLTGELEAWSQAPERIVVGIEPSISPKVARIIERVMGAKLAACVPLPVSEKVVGILVVFSPREQLPNEERAKLIGLADQAGLALENARLYKETQQLAAFNEGIIQSMAEGIVVEDADGVITFVNPAAAEMLGYAPDELVGLHWPAIIPLDQQPIIQAANERRMRGESDRYELELMHKDGWRISVLVGGSPRFDAEGQFAGTMAVFTDITERKRAEEALRRERDRAQKYLDIAGVIILADDAKGDVTLINQKGCEVLGYEKKEIIGKNWNDCFLPMRVQDEVSAVIERLRAGEVEPVEYYENPILTKGGEERTIAWHNTVLKDDEGSIIGILSSGEDITERVRAEEERERLTIRLHQQARQVEQILATVPAGVLLLDAEGQVLQANPMAKGHLAALAGAKAGDVLTHLGNRSLTELLTSPHTQGLWHEVKADKRIFEVVARLVENGSEPKHWVLVINDVTQERFIQAQLQQQERLAAVGELAAGIAHDFNNIMASIVLYAQMVPRTQELSERNRERMAVINQQARHATRLIEQILDFSRRAVLERRPLDLLPLLKEQVKLLERTLPEHIGIELDYGRDEYTVDADPTRMQQILTNLAVNARDAMPDGGTLCIGLERITVERDKSAPLPEMEAGEWVQLTVSDTGTGIPPDVLPYIFEPFFTTKAPGAGSGLGLAQVHGIVGQHEGHIDVTSQVGVGTTITINLPALAVTPSKELLQETQALPKGQGETILVVEDDARTREALADTLESINYRVLKAANGREALEVLERHAKEIVLVLSDLVMPEMGGQALFHALRQRGLTLPMVMLSGHPTENELRSPQRQKLAGWLLKPPSMEELAQLLEEVLKEASDRETN